MRMYAVIVLLVGRKKFHICLHCACAKLGFDIATTCFLCLR